MVEPISTRILLRSVGCFWLACAAFAQLAVTDLDKAWKEDLQLGQQFQRQGRIRDAEEVLVRALKTAEKIGNDSLPAAACLNGLAILYHSQKSYAAAEPLYLRALSIVEAKAGADHPRVGVLHKNLGELYRSQGRMAEAAEQLHRAFEITEKQLPPQDPGLVEPLKALAELDFMLGRFDDAIAAQKRVLAILEQSAGPQGADTVDCLNNLGVVYVSAGRFDRAEPWFQQALQAGEAAWGAEDPRLTRSLVYLADIWRRRLQLAEAENLLERSLTICGKHPQSEKAELAMALNNLAEIYGSQRYPKAEELFRRSISVWERVAGPEDPELATGLYNLACLYRNEQRFDEAEGLFQKALRILNGKLGSNDPRVAQVSTAYAEMLASLGRTARSVPNDR
jgi:tetratricopeptide (TPR) repeat protein